MVPLFFDVKKDGVGGPGWDIFYYWRPGSIYIINLLLLLALGARGCLSFLSWILRGMQERKRPLWNIPILFIRVFVVLVCALLVTFLRGVLCVLFENYESLREFERV